MHVFHKPKEKNMKYPLLAATFLALAVSACGDQQEAPAVPDPVAAPAEQEQAPAPVVDVPMMPPLDSAPAVPAEEPPPPPAEEPPPATEPAK
jgi:hypothetical protein